MTPSRLAAVAMLGVWLLGGCGSSGNPSGARKGSPASRPADPALGRSAGGTAQPFSLAGVFPQGRGRDLVLETCGSCHPLACSALGQRPAERWEAIQESHKDKLSGRSTADLNAMFSYLKENFNDTKPEPKIPAELAQQGCTPY